MRISPKEYKNWPSFGSFSPSFHRKSKNKLGLPRESIGTTLPITCHDLIFV